MIANEIVITQPSDRVSAAPLFDWGIDGLVIWMEELDSFGSLMAHINEALAQIAFAIELQTGWDHRTDGDTYHPLYGYRLLLRDATGLWYAIRMDEAGKFADFTPLEEFDYEIAYDKALWLP
ncbi:hypothetical protein [Larkinella terrae]|uniref:Uncharacterized protein n=1 Tax=Larkinella terrae TaxID=2025311 RepID=A0A7K0EG80_9BACT|nr:hypothetical protein [Larkinella terrae]MRS60833.1 hypothetical protein [Larkinella terrae]